jgi:transcriptional regulator with XRE-family HTH domain
MVVGMRKRIANGAAIRVIREARGLSQSAFGPKVDVSQGYLSQVESGDKAPSAGLLARIAVELKVPVEAVSYPACEACEQVAA